MSLYFTFSGLVRKSIARVLTVMNQTARQTIAVHLQGKKYLPLDMRAKKTRAIRRRLTAEEAGAKTLKQIKKDRHFPARKYVVCSSTAINLIYHYVELLAI